VPRSSVRRVVGRGKPRLLLSDHGRRLSPARHLDRGGRPHAVSWPGPSKGSEREPQIW